MSNIRIDNRIKGIAITQAMSNIMSSDMLIPLQIHAYGPRALMTKKGRINAKIRARRNREA